MKASNPMCRQAWSLPLLMRQQYADLEPKTRTVLTTEEIFSIQRIVLTGCGDSYAACVAVKHIFELLTDIPTEVVSALDLARYYHPKQIGFAPNNPLVIAVSNSGAVARLDEAIQFVNEHGGFTLGITGNAESPVGKNSRKMVKLDIPPFESAPGVRSYMVSVMALLLLGIRLGEVRGKYTMDTANAYRHDFLNQADQLDVLLPEMDQVAKAAAREWKDHVCFDFTGGGFDYATALYGCAKILEATGRPAMQINLEEWLHLNFFARDYAKIGTVIIANSTNPALSRQEEVIRYAMQMKRPLLVISDTQPDELSANSYFAKVPKTETQITMPLTQFVPCALLAGYLAELMDETYGRGCQGPWSFAQEGNAVRNSKLKIRKSVLK